MRPNVTLFQVQEPWVSKASNISILCFFIGIKALSISNPTEHDKHTRTSSAGSENCSIGIAVINKRRLPFELRNSRVGDSCFAWPSYHSRL
jgi:hypothetical protein